MSARGIVFTVAMIGLAAAPAMAQGSRAEGLEVAVGATYINRTSLGAKSANETTPTGEAFPLFTTSTTLSALTGGQLELGLHLSEHLEVFGAAAFGTRQFRIEASSDRENAAPVTASERLQQFIFTGGARWFFTRSRFAPFANVEAGQMRLLHEGKTLVETGLVYSGGAGISMLFAQGGSIGARLGGRAVMRPKDFLVDTKRVTPVIDLSVFMRF